MKFAKSLSLLICLLCTTGVYADSFTDYQGIVYNILTEPDGSVRGTCEVGDNRSFSKTNKITIPAALSSGGKAYNVTAIGNSAFVSNKQVTSVDLSSCRYLTTIGDKAFYNTRLTVLNLSGCSQLQTIGVGAFWGCNLYTIDFSGCPQLQIIGGGAFINCSNIESINFKGCTMLQSIDGSCFIDCDALTSIDLSGCTQLQTIGNNAFGSCSAMTSVNLSGCSQLTRIEASAFEDCRYLANIDLTGCSQLQTIENRAFASNPLLTSLKFEGSLKEIGYRAFDDCAKLEEVYCYAIEPPAFIKALVSSYNYLFIQPMTTTGTLYVPAGSEQAYRDDPYWGKAKNIIGVVLPPKSVEISAVSVDGIDGKDELKAGESIFLTANITPDKSTFEKINWSCNPVETINFVVTDDQQKGLTVTATVREGISGNVTIKATVDDTSVSDEYAINVSGDVLLGDANDNGTVTLADVITIANELLVKGSDTPSINVSFCFVNADVDKDRNLTLVDQTATTNIAMGLPAFPEEASALAWGTNIASHRLHVGNFTAGQSEIAVSLPGTNNYVSLQADLLLPQGMEVLSIERGNALADHRIAYMVNPADNRLRIIVYSLQNAPFHNEGTLFTIVADTRHGSPGIAFGDITVVDTSTRGRSLEGEGGSYDQTTAIGTIADDGDQPADVYDLSGRLVKTQATAAELRALTPGLYIIRSGTEARKVYIK